MEPPGRRRAVGHTLVEVAVATAVAGVVAALVLPGWNENRLRAGRADGVAALTRLQMAQERHRSAHGLYAGDPAALQGIGTASPEGRYGIELMLVGADGYRATATARPGEAQAGDRECSPLTLDVVRGFATTGPSARCWHR